MVAARPFHEGSARPKSRRAGSGQDVLNFAGTKIRAIDDYSLPQTNSGFSVNEMLMLDDVDSVAALAKFMLWSPF